ncbi:MAG: hypothetical protein M5U22_10050 [Thermoleophilia bacterium]|nr:hypothetical protein [Thermoleophilia bacterium]
MRRNMFFVLGVVIALAAALTIGIAVARGQGGSDLQALAPAELLAKVAQNTPQTASVSGDVAWTNDLLGTAALQLPGGDAGLASLLRSGSGRFWYQDGKIRFESQGSGGDLVAVLNGATAWVYSSQSGTATEFTLPAWPAGGGASEGETSTTGVAAGVDLPQKIQEMLDKLAPHATLTVSTDTVGGRDSYLLVLTPTASNTVLGTVRAAFDGETFLPLRVEVFAKGDAQPVLAAGFTRVSYDEIAAGTFDFSPPADAKVEHKTLSLPAELEGMMGGAFGHPSDASTQPETSAEEPAALTLDQAEAQAGFRLAVPAAPSLPFAAAYVIAPPPGGAAGSATGEAKAPVVVLRYGEGFGSMIVVETLVAETQWAQLTSALARVPMLGTPSLFGGHEAYQLGTRLGSIAAWRQADLAILVAGSVSRADLEAFAVGIHE